MLHFAPTLTPSALLIPGCSAPTSSVLVHREPPMLADPAGARSTCLYARSMEVARRCCRGVGDLPPPHRSAHPTPARHPLSPRRPSSSRTQWPWHSSPLIPHRRRQAKPGIVSDVARAPPLAPALTAGIDQAKLPSPMLQMYVSGVLVVSKVCYSCFLWMLQK